MNYELILMIELAQVYKKKNVEPSGIAEKHNLPVSVFDSIIEQLVAAGYITCSDGDLLLQVKPDEISTLYIIEN